MDKNGVGWIFLLLDFLSFLLILPFLRIQKGVGRKPKAGKGSCWRAFYIHGSNRNPILNKIFSCLLAKSSSKILLLLW